MGVLPLECRPELRDLWQRVTLHSKAGTSYDLGVPLTSFEFFLEPVTAGNMRSLRCQEDSEQLFGSGTVMALALKLSGAARRRLRR
jgi:hypothetical protein